MDRPQWRPERGKASEIGQKPISDSKFQNFKLNPFNFRFQDFGFKVGFCPISDALPPGLRFSPDHNPSISIRVFPESGQIHALRWPGPGGLAGPDISRSCNGFPWSAHTRAPSRCFCMTQSGVFTIFDIAQSSCLESGEKLVCRSVFNSLNFGWAQTHFGVAQIREIDPAVGNIRQKHRSSA